MRDEYRLNFIVDEARRVIIIRPIGDMPGHIFVERLFDAYAKLDAPWTYGRINDFRRFEGKLEPEDVAEIARRWGELAGGRDYHAYVGIVTADPLARIRVPMIAPQFPHETICVFTDYHQAMGWLLARDRTQYLDTLGPPEPRTRDSGAIRID